MASLIILLALMVLVFFFVIVGIATHESVNYYPYSDNLDFKIYDGYGFTKINMGYDVVPSVPMCTGSMHPVFGCNNTVLLVETNDVKVGDIISYKDPDAPGQEILHQIINKIGDCYVLRGRNNSKPDPTCVKKEDIRYKAIGVIFGVEKNGQK